MKFTEEDVNSYIVDESGNVYRVVSFSRNPSVTIERVEGIKQRSHFGAECLTADSFKRLV